MDTSPLSPAVTALLAEHTAPSVVAYPAAVTQLAGLVATAAKIHQQNAVVRGHVLAAQGDPALAGKTEVLHGLLDRNDKAASALIVGFRQLALASESLHQQLGQLLKPAPVPPKP